MKFNLKKIEGLEALNNEESVATNGGVFRTLFLILGTAIIADIALNPKNTAEQFMIGYNAATSKK